MLKYKTVEEISREWDISVRHVQYLCRTGKIDGALKRAGSWFIPEDAPIPLKNTKANARDFKFVGTKGLVFNNSIQLFMLKGYNDVSLRDIAESVGIRQSTIYNHFKSKQEILDTIYDFYCFYYNKERLDIEEEEKIIRTCSADEIIKSMHYEFKDEYKEQMACISKIVFQRIPIDERAREIASSLMLNDGVEYVESIFNRAIELGRFAQFDTHAMAVFVNSVRIFTLFQWVANPSEEKMKQVIEDENNLYQHAAKLLTDLNASS